MARTWEKGRHGLRGPLPPEEAWSPACFLLHLCSGIRKLGVLVITPRTAGWACARAGEQV